MKREAAATTATAAAAAAIAKHLVLCSVSAERFKNNKLPLIFFFKTKKTHDICLQHHVYSMATHTPPNRDFVRFHLVYVVNRNTHTHAVYSSV